MQSRTGSLAVLMRAGELITAGSQDAVKATADQLCLLPVNNGLYSFGPSVPMALKNEISMPDPQSELQWKQLIWSYMGIYKTVPQKN